MENQNREIFGFSKTMFLQCVVLFLGLCGGLLFSRYIYILTALFTTIICFTKDTNNIYYHLLFSMSFTVVYKLSPSSTSFFAYLMIITGIILMLRIKRVGKVQLFFILLFSLYLLLGMKTKYTMVFKMLMGIILLYFFVSTTEERNFKNHIMAFSLGVIGSSIVGTFRNSLPQLAAYFKTEYTIYSGGNLAHRFTGLNYDPNYYSMSVVFAVLLCLMLLQTEKKCKRFTLVVIILLLMFGFRSYSKMFLLCVSVISVILLLYTLKSPKMFFLMAISFGVALALIVTYLNKINYMNMMFARLFEGDISTGRFKIWISYFEYLEDSPFTLIFGSGVGHDYLSVGGPHNTYIEGLFFVGVVGTICYLLVIVSILMYRRCNRSRSVINYVLLLVFLIMNGVLGCFTINEMPFYLMLTWISLNICFKTKERKYINREISLQCSA